MISTQVEYEQLHATLPLLELQAEDGATREELEMSLDNLMEVNCFKQFFNVHRKGSLSNVGTCADEN